jgi:site-specific recombinase XerD
MTDPANLISFPSPGNQEWIEQYQQACLGKRSEATVDAYLRILFQFTEWVAKRPGHGKQFHPEQLTTTVTEGYLSFLTQFCQWLIDEKEALKRNPTRSIEINAQQTLAPPVLSPDQRFVLRHLVEKADDLRGKALFALGYWAGCRVSDVSHLLVEHAHVGPKVGWLHVGFKGEKFRDIDLLNEARRPLYEYLQHGGRDTTSLYVFTSQRSSHLTEDGIHAWFRRLKHQANHEEWELISAFMTSDMILPIALVKLGGLLKK